MTQTEPEPRWHWQDNDMSYIPYLTGDSDLMEAIYQSGGHNCDVVNGKYTIQFGSRSQTKKDSSEEKSRRIIRGTWYWQDSKDKWQPYPEIISETLEGHFSSGKFDTNLTDIGSSIIVVLNANGTGKQIFKGEDDIFQKIRRGYDGKVVSKGSDSDDYLIRQSLILDKDQTHKFLENQENQSMSQNSNRSSSDEIVSKREHNKSNSDSFKDPYVSNPSLKHDIQEQNQSSNNSKQQTTQQSVPIKNTKQRSRNPPRINLNAKSGVYKEGYAQYLSKKSWKKCYITLDKDCLTVFLNMKPKNRVYWVDIKDVREGGGGDPKNGYIFELDVYFETVKMKTFNIADTEDWIDSINVVIERATKPVENIKQEVVVKQNVEPVNQQQISQQQNEQNQQTSQQQNQQQHQQQQMPQQQNQQQYQQQEQNQQTYQQQQIPQQQNQQTYQQQQIPQQQNQQTYQQQYPQQTYQQQQYPQQTYQQQYPQQTQQPYQQFQQTQQPYQQFQQTQQPYQQFQQTQQPYQQFQQTQQPYQQYPQTNPQQFFGYNSYGY